MPLARSPEATLFPQEAASSAVDECAATICDDELPETDIDWDPRIKHRGPAQILTPATPTSLVAFDNAPLPAGDVAYVLDGLSSYFDAYAARRLRFPSELSSAREFAPVATEQTCLSPTGRFGYPRRRATAMEALVSAVSSPSDSPRLVACRQQPAVVQAGEEAFLVGPEPVGEDATLLGEPPSLPVSGTPFSITERYGFISRGVERLCRAVQDYAGYSLEGYVGLEAGKHVFVTATGERLSFDGPSCRLACRGTEEHREILGETTFIVQDTHVHEATIDTSDVRTAVGNQYPEDDADASGWVVAVRPTFDDPTDPDTAVAVPRLYVTSYVLEERADGNAVDIVLRPQHDLVKRFPDSPTSCL